MRGRSIILLINILLAASIQVISQYDPTTYRYFSLPANFSYSGITNSFFVGPGFFREDNSGGFGSYVIEAGGGIAWNTNDGAKPFTALRFYAGSLPGVMFGLSSQQYYNMTTTQGNIGNDIRLSGEFILALFGFVGYRYQHPVGNNESKYIARHAVTISFPIPVKKIKTTKTFVNR